MELLLVTTYNIELSTNRRNIINLLKLVGARHVSCRLEMQPVCVAHLHLGDQIFFKFREHLGAVRAGRNRLRVTVLR